MKRRLSVMLSLAALSVATPALADNPTTLGNFKSWTALTVGAGDNKTCYAIASPQSSLPAKAKRDPIGFLITDWPSRHAKAEPEVNPGYQFKDGSTATVQVGADKYDFFTKNDDGQGGAWMKDPKDEARLVSAQPLGARPAGVVVQRARGAFGRAHNDVHRRARSGGRSAARRGQSGDAPEFTIEREFDDVAAVINHIGGPPRRPRHRRSFQASAPYG